MRFVQPERKTLGQRIKQARGGMDVRTTQRRLGELIGKSRDMVARYEGDIDTPSDEVIRKIAEVTKVSYKWLRDGGEIAGFQRTLIEVDPPDEERYDEIPYWGTIPAGDWEMPSGDVFNTMQVEKSLAKEGRVAMRVAGESMMPRLQHGDIIHVQRSSTPREGVITLARNQNKDLTLKVLRHSGGVWALLPINPEFEQPKADQWEILGHAVVLERHMGPGRYIREVDELGLRLESRI